MNIYIRADASIHIGSGHIMRCLVLAEELVQRGHQVRFLCRQQAGDLIELIRQRRFKVITLEQVEQRVPKSSSDYSAWLQVSLDQDMKDVVERVDVCDLMIVDHYGITSQWEAYVKQALDCQIMAIDDLVREHNAEIILDQTLGRERDAYTQDATVLTGCDYALLASPFKTYRQQRLLDIQAHKNGDRYKVLLSMGGIDEPNATQAVLKVLCQREDCLVTVLLSPKAPHYASVKAFCARYDSITHIDFVENMAALMVEHDFAIGAPGTTSWERACLGLPSIIVPLADNQKTISENLLAARAVLKVELSDILSELDEQISTLICRYKELQAANIKLCDGLGCRRVVGIIEKIALASISIFQLRVAQESDIDTVYRWQQAPITRRYALNPNVPSYEQHVDWMKKKLLSTSDCFYIIEHVQTGQRLGVVRLDKQDDSAYLISIFIDPDFYGQGIAQQALSLVDELHPEWKICATVLKENKASQALFKKAHYEQVSDETFVRTIME